MKELRRRGWLFYWGEAHRVPGTPGPPLGETWGYLWISSPPQRPRSEWEAARRRWTGWAATQQNNLPVTMPVGWRCDKTKMSDCCSPSPGFYAAGWRRMCLRTSLSGQGLSFHLVYTCKTMTSKHNQGRSVAFLSILVWGKKETGESCWWCRGAVTLQFAQACRMMLLQQQQQRVKQRGDSAETLCLIWATVIHRLQWTTTKKEKKVPRQRVQRRRTLGFIAARWHCRLVTAPCPGSISREWRANISSYVMWQFPPEGHVGLLLSVVHHNYTNNSDLWFAAQRERDVASVQENCSSAQIGVFLLLVRGFDMFQLLPFVGILVCGGHFWGRHKLCRNTSR